MDSRRYYSMRTGKNPVSIDMDLNTLKSLFVSVYRQFESNSYFQEAFGYSCVDAGEIVGTLGSEIDNQIFIALRKPQLWPITNFITYYSEDDLFDMIEFLYDQVSKPVEGYYHSYGDCGWHYSSFDKITGKNEYRVAVNKILRDYGDRYELNEAGEIVLLAAPGLDVLFTEDLPEIDQENVECRISNAISKFRKYHSTPDERRDAIRDLADVLEYLRPQFSDLISSKDEGDLFNLANNFGIRHHNKLQKTDYDQEIWYPWMFYYYLSTIHAIVKLIKKNEI